MPQIVAHHLQLAGVEAALFDDISFTIEPGQRIALLGRNGVGKSTLLSLIQGETVAESGTLVRESGLRVRALTQEVPIAEEISVFEAASRGNETVAAHEIYRWLSILNLPSEELFSALSGGMKRKVLLARALAIDPDVLLLDEPTNHLDVETILWLEQCLLSLKKTLLFVSHDRAFVRKMATTIWELDRGRLTVFDTNYDNYLTRKEELLNAEALAFAREDKKLAQEEVWIRQGVQARRTRNEGRVRALKQLRLERAARREVLGQAELSLSSGATSGKEVVSAKEISFSYAERDIVNNFSTTILRGDKIGILGPNGVGKTTLIHLLLGELTPQQGSVKLGTQLQIAYFDQLRATLQPEKTVLEIVAEGRDFIQVGDQSKHVMSYLQDFLFSPKRARAKIKTLSGGEKNRLLLAKLFTKPANVLVLDEPTNDLDIETLELLEALLLEYTGTLLLVSHDRDFLNSVVTSTLAYEGEGRWQDYAGGYDDYCRQALGAKSNKITEEKKEIKKPTASTTDRGGVTGLSFKEKKELEELPRLIQKTEAALLTLQEQMAASGFYQQTKELIAETTQRLAELEAECQGYYARWELLESLSLRGNNT